MRGMCIPGRTMCVYQVGLSGAQFKVSNKILFCFIFFTNILLYSQFLAYTGYIAVKQLCVPYANISTLAMIPTYSRILSAIKKVLQELMEEYQEVKKSLWDLIEGQERNTA